MSDTPRTDAGAFWVTSPTDHEMKEEVVSSQLARELERELNAAQPMKGHYKVPFRQVYCVTFRQWLATTILAHVVYRLDPPKLPQLPGL